MSQTPSPTFSPSPKTSSATVSNSVFSAQAASDIADAPALVSRPSIAFAGVDADDTSRTGRCSSIQFAPSTESAARASKPKLPPLRLPRRVSSPPPPLSYESRVSFDTFDNKDATDISFTLVSRHKDYAYTRRSRTFLCGTDQNEYSEFALEWLVEELVEDGDEIVCLRVVDKDSRIASDPSVQQGIYKEEARSSLDSVQKKNEGGKAISLVLELAVGKVPETIQRMIQIYAPTCLIVGTRGRSLGGISGLLPGSVSKYCLQNSPVPVVVVRPEDKREKKRAKRLANRSRRGYSSILTNATTATTTTTTAAAGDSSQAQTIGEASEGEAQAVAKAIGLNRNPIDGRSGSKERTAMEGEGTPLSRTVSVKSDVGMEESPSPTGPLGMDEEDDDDPGEEGLDDVLELEGEGLGSPVGSEGDGEEGGGAQGVPEEKGAKDSIDTNDVIIEDEGTKEHKGDGVKSQESENKGG